MGLVPRGDSQARPLALKVAFDILQNGYTLDEAEKKQNSAFLRLDPRDRAFARALNRALFRNWQRAAAVQAAFLAKPLPKRAETVDLILKLGIVQMLALELPTHATINETVGLLSAHPRDRAMKGVINAVLRAVDRDPAEAQRHWSGPRSGVSPKWMLKRWSAAFGKQAVNEFLPFLEQQARLVLTVKPDVDAPVEAVALGGSSYEMPEGIGEPTQLPGFEEGDFWVQDAAASSPAQRLIAELGNAGKSVIDLCAAPGGKTLQLAAAGHQVTAVDVSEGRLGRLRENLERTGLNAEIVAADALTWQPDTLVDAVLLDAPCSATGTLRRHPELPHLRDLQTIDSNVELQQQLLARSLDWLKPGGLLCYAVCTLEQTEGEAQMVDLPPGVTLIQAQRLFPGTLSAQGNDGFYWALLRKD